MLSLLLLLLLLLILLLLLLHFPTHVALKRTLFFLVSYWHRHDSTPSCTTSSGAKKVLFYPLPISLNGTVIPLIFLIQYLHPPSSPTHSNLKKEPACFSEKGYPTTSLHIEDHNLKVEMNFLHSIKEWTKNKNQKQGN